MSAFDDSEIIAAARAGFLDEAGDMLHQFEAALLVMESAPDDADNLNAAFRAAHTIKGTAGLFGCDAVVSFTHEVETLLEGLRSGQLKVTEPIAAALLQGRDQMQALIEEVRSGHSDPAVAARSLELGAELRRLYGGDSAPAAPSRVAAAAAPAAPAAGQGLWHLSLRFGPDALRNGLDPLAFIRYLGQVGQVVDCHTLADLVPPIEQIDPETCSLGFEIRLQSTAARKDIENVFEFALDDCSLRILDPGANAAAYAALLRERCGEDEDQRSELAGVWLAQGVALDDASTRRPAAAAPAEAEAPPAPVERRGSDTDRRAGGDRRAARGGRGGEEARFVKVRADKLDHLIDLIGELVIAGSGAQMVANLEGSSAFLEATQRVSDLVQATRDGALALRMVPVGETFSRFHRVVRDVSKQLGKEIELVITGGDTELDKSMVETIADPLMHLVRNSLDHGIETPSERHAAGKSTQGRLTLNAFHEGGSIVIEVIDDGRGLRRDRILGKAIERGLVAADAQLTDAEVWQLIFAPGFSTADAVTDLSGRGVGMDVVKRNIESLRGQIHLTSREGQGTVTQIRLPLTLAMIDGFLTMVGGVHYVLPLSVVSECIEVPPECQREDGRTCGTFDLRGEVLPYVDLAHFYGVSPNPAAGGRRSLIVVRDGTVRVGLVVDRLLGEHQTVIKPLAGIFKHLKALAGSTILGSGDVALVLDLQGLVSTATRDQRPSSLRHSNPANAGTAARTRSNA
ncbi:MAG: chemotaxis protein CheA [Rubrivivax sp.]|nr:chemotaxis protein CheA [Rubrivivax sp.]